MKKKSVFEKVIHDSKTSDSLINENDTTKISGNYSLLGSGNVFVNSEK